MEAQRQSALHRRHLAAGVRLQSFAGWQLPSHYAESLDEMAQVCASVGVSDASYLTKLDLRGELPPGTLGRQWKLTPTRSLITSLLPVNYVASSSITDVTSVYGAILLAGPKAPAVLHKLTTLNVRETAMPDGAARQTRLAHVNATVLRTDHAGLPGFLVLTTRDVAEHVWDSLLHSGHAFSIRPFGLVAQQQWLGGNHGDA
jgi:heterotetrameric sarcosine oxidase gamma subunit